MSEKIERDMRHEFKEQLLHMAWELSRVKIKLSEAEVRLNAVEKVTKP